MCANSGCTGACSARSTYIFFKDTSLYTRLFTPQQCAQGELNFNACLSKRFVFLISFIQYLHIVRKVTVIWMEIGLEKVKKYGILDFVTCL